MPHSSLAWAAECSLRGRPRLANQTELEPGHGWRLLSPRVARREILLVSGASAVAKGRDAGSPGSSLVYSTFRRRQVAGVLPRGRLATNKTHRLPAPTSTSPALLQSHLDVHPCHFDLGTEEGLHRKLFLSSLVLLWLPYLLSTYHGCTYLLI